MSAEKHQQLIEKLSNHTKSDDLDWKPTSDHAVLMVAFSKFSILLRQSPSREEPDTYDYLLRIINGSGEVIEEIAEADLSPAMSRQKAYNVMHELFEIARRKALGVDAAIDSIIRDLDDIIPF